LESLNFDHCIVKEECQEGDQHIGTLKKASY